MTVTLLTARPSKFWRMQAPGGAEHWVVMYNVPAGRCEQLPIGKRFAQVTSPSSYQSEPRWSLTQFEIRLRMWAGHGADGKKVEREGRAYTQINQRVLTDEEIAHMKSLIENYRKEQADATPELSKEDSTRAEEQTGADCAEAGDPAGVASADWAPVAYQLATEPERSLCVQEQAMEGAY